MRLSRRVRIGLALGVTGWLVASAVPAWPITEEDVERACAQQDAALDALAEARARLDEATREWEELTIELDAVSTRERNLSSILEDQQGELAQLEEQVAEQAVELYMNGGDGMNQMVFTAASVDELVAGQEFLETITATGISSLDDLTALRAELERLRSELSLTRAELTAKTEEAANNAALLETAAEDHLASYEQLAGECKELYAAYQVEKARLEAEEAARRSGGSGGIGDAGTPGFICPMNPAAVSFIDSWGAPRSGGRSHQGTDVMAPYGQPVMAVNNGTAYLSTSSLGGISIWLSSDSGTAYYYAHLSGYAGGVGNGGRVETGQVIAYNGNTGNAAGGAPHVHFEIHPGGVRNGAVNPYPTLKRACG
jgi:peptidoglycan LD-endopeptidase LytH